MLMVKEGKKTRKAKKKVIRNFGGWKKIVGKNLSPRKSEILAPPLHNLFFHGLELLYCLGTDQP